MNVLSLFDGMSCGQLALNQLGFKIDNYYASEIDKNAIKLTQHHFPNTIQLGDVTKINSNDLPNIDLLIGGSPCQGFSLAGKKLNFDDPRSKLFFEYVRLLKETNPKYFLLENVRMKKEYQDVITSYLGVKPIMINSSSFSAQDRIRYYWTNIQIKNSIPNNNEILEDILEDEVDGKYVIDPNVITEILSLPDVQAKLEQHKKTVKTLINLQHQAKILNDKLDNLNDKQRTLDRKSTRLNSSHT